MESRRTLEQTYRVPARNASYDDWREELSLRVFIELTHENAGKEFGLVAVIPDAERYRGAAYLAPIEFWVVDIGVIPTFVSPAAI